MEILLAAARLSAPLLVTTWAAIICRRVGVFNLALDCGITTGAFAYLCVTAMLGTDTVPSPVMFATAIAFALMVGTFIGGFYGWLIARKKLEEIITGIALNIAVLSVIGAIGKWRDIDRAPAIIPAFVTGLISRIRVIDWVTIGIFAFSFVLAWVYGRTVPGRRLSSVGTCLEAAQQVAIPYRDYRVRSAIAAGAVSASAGVLLLLLGGGQFSYRIAGAYGFVALAFGVIGEGRFIVACALAFVYGAVQVPELQERLQLTTVPDQLSLAAQYLLPLAIVIAIDVWQRRRAATSRITA